MGVISIALLVWVTTIITLSVGAGIGVSASKGQSLKLPNPIKTIEEHKERAAAKEERTIFETNLSNIDNYDGTGLGQKDFE